MAVFVIEKPPLTLSPVVWFSAVDTPLGSVASWTDKSGNGRHATQIGAGFQPICAANLQAGKNGLQFSRASGTYLTSTFGFTTSSNCTIFLVAKLTTLTSAGTNDLLFDGIDVSNRQALVVSDSLGKFTWGSNTATAGATSDTNIHIHTMQGGTTGQYRIDGTAQFTNTNVGTQGVAGLTINSRYTVGNKANVYMFELIYYNYKLSASKIVYIERYLANCWGTTIS